MTENKRFNVFDVDGTIFLEDHIEGSYHIGEIGNVDVNCLNDIADKLNELAEENKQLKAKVDDKEVAVKVECEKLMQRVFDLIDEKVDELEKKYKFGQEVFKGCPMHNIRFGINVLKELKKELLE